LTVAQCFLFHCGCKAVFVAKGEFTAKYAGRLEISGTRQTDRFWWKFVAPLNIYAISVTLEVSQWEMSWLNKLAPENIQDIISTPVVQTEEKS